MESSLPKSQPLAVLTSAKISLTFVLLKTWIYLPLLFVSLKDFQIFQDDTFLTKIELKISVTCLQFSSTTRSSAQSLWGAHKCQCLIIHRECPQRMFHIFGNVLWYLPPLVPLCPIESFNPKRVLANIPTIIPYPKKCNALLTLFASVNVKIFGFVNCDCIKQVVGTVLA